MAGLFGWIGRLSETSSRRDCRRRHRSVTRTSGDGRRQSRVELLERRHLLAIAAPGDSSPEPLWQTVGFDDALPELRSLADTPGANGHRLNIGELRSLLAQAPHERAPNAAADALVIAIPTPTEGVARFRIVESPIMAPELAAKFPTIKTFAGQGVDDATATIRCDITPTGFHAQVLSSSGGYYIDPWPSGGADFYASYYARAGSPVEESVREWPATGEADFLPGPPAANRLVSFDAPEPFSSARSGTQLRTYRLAVAATAEYTAFHGGTVLAGQAAIVTAINRVSGIYERDLSVRLELVANNDLLVYTNGSTDPYTNTDPSALVTQNQTNIDAVIGDPNYDIGHVFSTGGGGLAYLGVVGYTGWKARGATGISNPTGDSFYVDYVAHEMGHQFNAHHTFNVSDSQRDATAAYEPGSGSTIMAYAGLFGANNLQSRSDDYFHSKSFDEIITFVDTTISTVGTRTPTGNNIPVVDAGADYTIPARTPFALTATGSDLDGDTLTYCWEERDLGPAQSLSDPDNGSSPLFRSFSPTTSPTRYFPRLANLLANTASIGEKLPTTNRMLNFRVTARDNRSGGGGINTDDVQLTVVDTGAPFQVTSPNSAVTWMGGTTQTVTWNVAGTTANGINASNVDILLSTDGGNTFAVLLASDTPNDGAQDIVVPNTASTTARVKVQPVGNVFFDVSDYNLTVQQGPNHAPVLDPSAIMTLASITEDDTTNVGTLVSAIIASAGGDRITDPDPGALEGIAVTLAVNSNGTWQYSIDGGGSWLSFGVVGDSAARLLASDSQTRIRFVPGANIQGTIDPGIQFRAWDRTSGVNGGVADTLINGGETPFSSETEAALITVTGVNDAPILDPSGNMSLGTIAEDSLPGTGTLVSAILASAGGERITDVDLFAQTGIAVIGVDNTNGTWEFSIDAGGSWLPIGSLTAGEARLLAATADTRVRFLPNSNYSGTVDPGLTFRAWDVTAGVNGGTGDASTGGGASAFSLATETASITVTGVNDAPVLDNTGDMKLVDINEDDAANPGTRVSEIILSAGGDRITDPDPGALEGIAISAVAGGTWQYRLTATSSWKSIAPVSSSSALHLAAENYVRFVPLANFSGTVSPGITFSAWDRTNSVAVEQKRSVTPSGGTTAYSVDTETASITVLPGNDAPVLNNSGTMTLNPINEDDTTNGGTLVSEIILSAGGDRITDIDPDALEGIAIIDADIGSGSWQFSIDGGSTWSEMPQPSASDARLLAADARIRFVPVANYFGTAGNALTFRAWDQSSGTNGGTANPGTGGGSTAFSTATETADITVNPVNDAPVLNTAANPVLPDVPEDTADPAGQSLPQIVLAGTISDADGAPVQAIAVTAVDDLHGTWQYQAVGETTWINISASPDASLLLDAWYKIRFVPAPDFFGTATFTFRAWDKSAGFAGGTANTTVNGGATPYSVDADTATVVVTPVNDAPILSTVASPRLTDIPANVFDPPGETIGAILIDGSITDPDGVAVEAIAVTAVDNAHGTWQYQLAGQSTWANIATSATNSLLLGAAEKVRFIPEAGWFGEATFTFRAWDQSEGAAGSLADSSITGGTAAFSADSDTVSVTVLPAAQNQAPVLNAGYDPVLTSIAEDNADPTGDTVAAIVVDGSISDPDGAAIEAIAVTAVDSSHGVWEYQLNGQSTWTVLIATSTSSLLLGPADKIRFVPAQEFSGSATFTFRAWDQSTGSTGATVDTSVNGGTTAFSAATDMASVAVLGANDAPILNPIGAMFLAAIDEDAASNAGTLVSAIIDSAGVDQITDADPDAVEGIAVIAADSTHGFWQFSTDGGSNWLDMGSPSTTAARLLAADSSTHVRFVPSADFSGLIGNGLTFVAWDRTSGSSGGTADASTRGGATAFSETVKTASIVVNAVNDAPLLDSSGDTSLATINEDDTSNAGTLISAMIASAGSDRITDVDTGAVEGVAITGASSAYGSWQYSTNDGSNWHPLGTPTVAAARLLAADASTRIRFVPNTDFNGPIDAAITFRAWDVTAGTNGETADTGAGGGTSAFSVNTESASITVAAVNDAPLNTLPGYTPAVEDTPLVFTAPNTFVISDVDAGSSPVKVTLIAASGLVTLGSVAGLSFIEGDGIGDLTAVFTGTMAAINAAFDGLSFSPDSNYSGIASIRITTDDLGNTGSGGAKSDTDTLNISIAAINDAPVIVLPSAQTTGEDTPLVLSGAGGNLIAVTDIDAITYPVRVALTAANGVMTLSGTLGLTFTTGDGTADASMDFTGALASVNVALNGLSFSPAWNFVGTASIAITANDQGNTGSGGSQIDSDVLTIAVTPENDAPIMSESGMMSLPAIEEDEYFNSGALVSAVIASAGGDPIFDYDEGALEGIAVTAADNSNGVWQYSIDGGANWIAFGLPGSRSARLLAADSQTRVRFVPNADFNGTISDGLTFVAWDQTDGVNGGVGETWTRGGTTAFSIGIQHASIVVNSINDAPVLDNTGSMSLVAIQKNAFDNPGTSVAAIINSAGGNRITDVDAGAIEGIAVTAVDNANGTWEFSTNDGDSWTAFGAPVETASRLLAADAQTRVRFVPSPDYMGTVLAGIIFRAWDRTSGVNGGTADASSPGGTSAFSLAFETASIAVDSGAQIRGVKWLDADGDGLRDAGESGLEGWTIFLDNNGNGLLDSGERSTVTASDGSYVFQDLDAGTYTVAEDVRWGWQQTSPQPQVFSQVSFPAPLQASIRDSLLDGTPDAFNTGNWLLERFNGPTTFRESRVVAEIPLASLSGRIPSRASVNFELGINNGAGAQYREFDVYVYAGNGVAALSDYTAAGTKVGTVSISVGSTAPRYSLDVTAPLATLVGSGTSHLGIRLDPITDNTFATLAEDFVLNIAGSPGTHTISVALGQVVDNAHFGNHASPGEIAGISWNDLDGDGQRDGGENGIPGQTLFLDTNRNGEREPGELLATTAADGSYRFTGVEPGLHSVVQLPQYQWQQTSPALVTAGSGMLGSSTFFTSGTLVRPMSAVYSPDGRQVYVIGATNATLEVYAHDPASGTLSWLQTFTDDQSGVDGLRYPLSLAISPDGRHIYVGGNTDDAIAIFQRNTATGLLSFVSAVRDSDPQITALDSIVSTTVSPDGLHVYATAGFKNSLAVFARNATTGGLTLVQVLHEGVDGVAGLRHPETSLVSPDGRHVYVSASDNDTLAVFRRDPATGQLAFVELLRQDVAGVAGLDNVKELAISPDGSHVYTAAWSESAIGIFGRDAATGRLSFAGAVRDGESADGLLSASSVAVSPDGGYVYATGWSEDAVSVFQRDAVSGGLSFVQVIRDTTGGRLDGARSVRVSPTGRHVLALGEYANYQVVLTRDGQTAASPHPVLVSAGSAVAGIDFGNVAMATDLTVVINRTSVAENIGAVAAVGTVIRTGNLALALEVTLASSDTSEAIVPATVTVPAGLSGVTFNIDAVNDNIVDGTQTVTITASTAGFTPGVSTLDVTDDETPGFTIIGGPTVLVAESGTSASFDVVLSAKPLGNVVIAVSSGDTGEASVSTSSLNFSAADWNVPQRVTVTGIDDAICDGDQNTIIRLSIDDVLSDDAFDALPDQMVAAVTVDDDVAALTLTIAAASISEGAGPGATTATITRNTDPTNAMAVVLSSSDASEAAVPVSVTIPAGQTSVQFAIDAVDDAIVDGIQAVSISGTAVLWSKETVDSAGDVGAWASLATDSANQPRIAYEDRATRDLKYAAYSAGAWSSQTVDGSTDIVGQYASLVIDSQDRPHIAYQDFSNTTLRYAYYNDTSWQLETADTNSYLQLSLAVNDENRPLISAFNHNTFDLNLAERGATGWSVTTLSEPKQSGYHTSLALDAAGNPWISYFNVTDSQLMLAKRISGVWQFETIDSGSSFRFTSLELDSLGRPHVSYYDVTRGDIKYAYYDGSSWQRTTIDSVGTLDAYTSLELDATDRPSIGYSSSGGVRFATFDGARWTMELVASGASYPSLAINSDGIARIAYYDTAAKDLVLATRVVYQPGSDTLDVTDDDVLTLSVSVAASAISEADGAGATTGTVTRNDGDLSSPLTVYLSSGDPGEAQVAATVVIPSGQATASFAIDAVDDEIVDGAQVVTITAAAAGYVNGVDLFSVTDDDWMPVVGNASALLAENDTITISAEQLSATDADDDAATLIFRLVSVPARGQLQRQGTTLAAGSTFIQQDITDGKIGYAHDGSEQPSDSFAFTVADPAGNQTAEHAFSITITPVNDAPAVLSPLSDVFVEEDASNTVLALADVFSDVDPGDVLSYSVTVAHTIDSVVNDIRESSYKHVIEDQLYTHLGDNRGFGPQHDLARENIASYFAGLGLSTVQEPFQYNSQTYYNVVATKIGAERPNDVYLVGAHYDSVNNPGADDNASGVAAVMELARVLSQYQFEATLCFVAFDREEQGLYGSNAYAAAHAADQIRGMISLDMIAYNPGGLNKVRLYDYVPGGEIKADLAAAFDAYGRGVTAVVESASIGASDHRPFEQRGFDAALVIEHEVWSNPYYHQASDSVDTFGYLDYEFASKVTGAIAGYLVTEAVLDDAPSVLAATIADGVLTLDYHENQSGSVWVTVRATDLSSASVEDTFAVWVDEVNDAPILDPTGSMSLADIDEDDTANSGTLVAAIIASAGPSVDWITDVDHGALEGIAIIGAATNNGVWEFSTDNGGNWSPLGTVSAGSARLLAADAATRVRFVPAADINGLVDPAITFRAWDRTSGANGDTADTTSHGGTSAFSTAIETASINVISVSDMPMVTSPAAAVAVNADSFMIAGTAEADCLVRVYRDLNNNSQIDAGDDQVGQQQLTGGGTAFAVSVSLVQNAVNNFLVTATDVAGSISAPADVPTITEDSQAPAAPVVTIPGAATTANAASYLIQGTAEANSFVRLYVDVNNNGLVDDGEALAGQQQVTGGGTAFAISVALLQNAENNFAVTATDAAGNVSPPADVPTITEDSQAPVAPLVTIPAAAATVNAASYLVQGTTEANSLVTIYVDADNDSVVDAGETLAAQQQLTGGATSYSISTSLTQDAANNFVVTATDAAGNVSPVADVPTITEDSQAPTADIVDVTPDPRSTAVGIVTINFSEGVSEVSIADFTLTRDGVGVDISGLAVTGSGTSYTLDLSSVTALPGSYVLTLVAAGSGIQDAAGNALGADANDAWTMASSNSTVVGRHIFYNNSYFDNNPAAGRNDDNAIASDKQALLPGQTAGFAHYTSYSRGLNGIMIDFDELPAELTTTDFQFKVGNTTTPDTWTAGPQPTVAIRRDVGAALVDRVVLVWPDAPNPGSISKQWLQITVLANERTGLSSPDVFYFGNAMGDTGAGNLANVVLVDVNDEFGCRTHPRNFLNPAPIEDPYDFNRDTRVDVVDEFVARSNPASFLNGLKLFATPIVSAIARASSLSASPRHVPPSAVGMDPARAVLETATATVLSNWQSDRPEASMRQMNGEDLRMVPLASTSAGILTVGPPLNCGSGVIPRVSAAAVDMLMNDEGSVRQAGSNSAGAPPILAPEVEEMSQALDMKGLSRELRCVGSSWNGLPGTELNMPITERVVRNSTEMAYGHGE